MAPRRLWPALLAIVAASGAGCTILDRESYSLVYRKKAHQYEPAEEKPQPEAIEEPEAVASPDPSQPDPRQFVRHDLDALIENLAPRMEAFRPFSYCYLHESSHVVESVFAVALAPVEYPTAVTGNFTYLAVTTTVEILMAPLDALFPPAEKPLTIEERRKAPSK
jgi:hypothetical protein